MNQVVLALAMLATASARAPAVLSEDYTFAQYMVDFKRSYSKREMLAREKAFEAAKARMIAHNKSGKTWTENVNELTDALPAEVSLRTLCYLSLFLLSCAWASFGFCEAKVCKVSTRSRLKKKRKRCDLRSDA